MGGVKTSSLLSSSEKLDVLETFQTNQGILNTYVATSIADLETFETNQGILNTSVATSITDLETFETSQGILNTSVATSITDLETFETNQGTLNTNLENNKLDVLNYQPNIDNISSGTFATNILTYTYNESSIYMNQLTQNNVFDLNLNIINPLNNKTYKQKIIIDCLQFKGYINVLRINNDVVEIKYLNGDNAINLAPIAGYSNILQTLELTRINDTWFCLSKMQLFYNSISNFTYDITLPVITLEGVLNIDHQINTVYSEPGFSASDNIDGDITANVFISGDTVNTSQFASYTINYDVVDARGNNAIRKIRIINIIDTVNPIVVLNGDSTINVNLGFAYTELGATVTDNSLENLTVVITGSVDINEEGSYTVLYTATDSQGNSHQIGRLVTVLGLVYNLQFSNPATDLFTHVDFLSRLPAAFQPTNNSGFTIANHATSYLNGSYNIEHCGMFVYGFIIDLFNLSGTFKGLVGNSSFGYQLMSSIYGNIVGPYNKLSYNSSGDGLHTPQTSANGVVVFHTVNDNLGTSYNGEYFEISFPFYIQISKLIVYFSSSTRNMTDFAILGKKPDGTYRYISGYTNSSGVSSQTINIVTTIKYDQFRFIVLKNVNQVRLEIFRLQLFGDIYTI